MKIEINIINAFTKDGKGGNPAAVVLDAHELSPQQKQKVAILAGLSETAFISRSAVADFRFDFFTPARQIADCGHATVAAFAHLKQIGKISPSETNSSKEIIDGRREIMFKGREVYMEQRAPEFSQLSEDDATFVIASLGLSDNGYKPLISDNGNRFVLLDVENKENLSALKADMKLIRKFSEKHDLIGYYIFSRSSNTDATTRMFAPAYGIPEESATGMAAGQLAAYLHHNNPQKQQFHIEQGHFMKPASPSLIKVDIKVVDDGTISSLFAGGNAQLITQQIVEI
jgi:PhzF family phenazine biosynthesis protein